jgi:Flp pilus assembly pilin Flp
LIEINGVFVRISTRGELCSSKTVTLDHHSRIRATQMMKNFGGFLTDESGSAAVEYGVFAAGISGAILIAIKEVGPKLYGAFSSIAEALPGVVAFGL